LSAPGRLDQRIEIERATRVVGADASRSLQWAPIESDANPYAAVKLKSGSEADDPSGVAARQSAMFTIRARSDISNADRIKWGGWIWNIEAVGRPVARSMYQTITATAGTVSA